MNIDFEIWDPNSVNPYGRELAGLLSRTEWHCRLWKPQAQEVSGVAVRADLATSRRRDGMVRHVLNRIFRPLEVAMRCSLHRRPLIIVWSRGTFESLVFLFATLFTRIVFVDHNPRPERALEGLPAFAQSLLRRRCFGLVIHSEQFRGWIEESQLKGDVMVARHPLFDSWRSHHQFESRGIAADGRTRVLFAGALRPDKGSAELHHLAQLLPADEFLLCIVGHGMLPDALGEVALDSENLLIDVRSEPLPDQDLADALTGCDLLVAPYVAATASGTLLLAMVFDRPTIAFHSGALADVLLPEASVPAGDLESLVGRIRAWREKPFATYRQDASDYQSDALREWVRVVRTCL
jgi:glycosyltransferase involved in cell wall biosynthesis